MEATNDRLARRWNSINVKTADTLLSENRALRDRVTLIIEQSRRDSEPISLTEESYPASPSFQRLPAATADSAPLVSCPNGSFNK